MWLTLTILAYLFFALASFWDKYILGGPLPSPKIYSFYVGLLALSALLLIPIGVLISFGFLTPLETIFPEPLKVFLIPELSLIILALATGMIFLLALFAYYRAIRDFEISRVVPAVGGIIPLFTLGIIYFFVFIPLELGFQKLILGSRGYLALIFLILGSVILTLHREKLATLKSLKISFIAAFLFSLSYVLSKIVYSFLPFWPGFIWIRMGTFLGAMFFLAFSEVRAGIFNRAGIFRKKIALPFLFAKGAGGLGSIFQNRAIFLAPVIFLPIITALSGIQYVFLLILVTLLFFKFPKILEEEISKKVLFQKIIAILLIGTGLILLALG